MSRKPYLRKLPALWWLGQGRYTTYMIRELTCVFIGAYAAVILLALMRLSQGRADYEAFLLALRGPGWIAFHVLALAFALYHTATWFGVAPKAMPLRVGGKAVPGAAVIAAHYAGWIAVTAAVLVLAIL